MDPSTAAFFGGAAGSLIGLVGVFISHQLKVKQERNENLANRLERIAMTVDDVINQLFKVLKKDRDLKDVFVDAPINKLRTEVGLYLPDAEDDATDLANAWIEVMKELRDFDKRIEDSETQEEVLSAGKRLEIKQKELMNIMTRALDSVENKLKLEIRRYRQIT